MLGTENFADAGYKREAESSPTLDSVRLKDGSPVHYAFLPDDMIVMDRAANEEAKNKMADLFATEEEFVLSLNGLSKEDVNSLVTEKLLRREILH